LKKEVGKVVETGIYKCNEGGATMGRCLNDYIMRILGI